MSIALSIAFGLGGGLTVLELGRRWLKLTRREVATVLAVDSVILTLLLLWVAR